MEIICLNALPLNEWLCFCATDFIPSSKCKTCLPVMDDAQAKLREMFGWIYSDGPIA